MSWRLAWSTERVPGLPRLDYKKLSWKKQKKPKILFFTAGFGASHNPETMPFLACDGVH